MGFPTEQDIYHRLRWDPRFDVQRCSVTIRLRQTSPSDPATKRVPYVELDTNTVPWHRIVEFWIDDELVWSRPERIDRLDEIAARTTPDTEASPAAPAAMPTTSPLVPWQGAHYARPSETRTLRIVTWNLLFDRYDAERLRSEERWQHAFDLIAALDADVIVLVEVTPKLWRLVLAQPWAARYMATHDPDARRAALEPYGQTVLSRHAIVSASSLPLSRDKRAVFATLDVGGRAVGVAAVHLTSNRKAHAATIRAEQLASVLAIVDAAPLDAWFVVGDFNGAPDELSLPGFDDAWSAVRGDEPGLTFDLARNELARAASVTGRSVRMDRIHVRGARARACELVGEHAGPCGLPPSDHFGVVAELELVGDRTPMLASVRASSLASATASPRSALIAIPPLDAWGPLQRIRCQDDRNWRKWPPHVTLFHPFVARAWQAAAIDVIEAVAAQHEPFELALDRVEAIDGRGQIIVLEPRNGRAIGALYAALEAAIPAVARDRPFRPHLTIGRTGRRVALSARWLVDRLAVVELDDSTGRMETVAEIALGRRDTRRGMRRETLRSNVRAPDNAHAALVQRIREVAAVAVEPFGSSVYAPEQATDLDLLVRGDAAVEQRLRDHFALVPAGSNHLRGTIDSVAVDIAITDDARILAGAADATTLRDHLHAHGRHEAFAAAWPEVRRFARMRGLLHNGLGYFGGFGWALLLAVPLVHDERVCAVPAANAFDAWLEWVATLRPHARIGLDAIRDDDPAQLYLAAPAPPSRDIARHLTPGTVRTFYEELRRPKLVDLADEPPPGSTLEITGADRQSRGRYEGAALSLIRELELRVGRVRVWGRFEGAAGDDPWIHRITVPTEQAEAARAIVVAWLASTLGDRSETAPSCELSFMNGLAAAEARDIR